MPKDSETSRYAARRTHRTYTPDFKAELVAACQVPGTSITAMAGAHAMNANVLHRWLKAHARNGCHGRSGSGNAAGSSVALHSQAPTFIPVQLLASQPMEQPIKVEICKSTLTMSITWPGSASADFASWTTGILK